MQDTEFADEEIAFLRTVEQNYPLTDSQKQKLRKAIANIEAMKKNLK